MWKHSSYFPFVTAMNVINFKCFRQLFFSATNLQGAIKPNSKFRHN